MKHLLKPLEPPFSPDIEAILARYPRTKSGYLLRLFRLFANSTRFLTDKGVANLLDTESPLSLREREIVILRTTANKNCEYEWGIHVSIFSRQADLTEEQVAATRTGDPNVACWPEDDRLLIHCVDDICQYAKIQEKNYAAFQDHWTAEQQLEILSLCGNYHTISFVANSARLENEEIGARFPASC
ncbi:MAG: carboxymuconolactone decarboxylase family protein [Sneathiella sp.]